VSGISKKHSLAIFSLGAISKLIGLESVVNYTVFLPLTVRSGKYARQLLEMALKIGLEPTPLPVDTDTLRKLSLYLPPILTAQIEAYPSFLSRSDLIRGLVSAAIYHSNGQSTAVAASKAPKWNLHRVQEEMVDTLMRGIRAKKITLLEGSTGIGKSRVIAESALRLPPSTKVGIFAPTLSVLYQLVEEFLNHAKALKIDPPSIALYIGKRNFVDLHKLEEILQILEPRFPEAAARTKTWIEEGGPSITRTSRLLKKHVPVQWLVDDLIEIVPEISASAVACDDLSQPVPGLQAYQKAKEGIDYAQVIFSTHTMFCLSALNTLANRPALFPGFGTVFLDEAHQLEEAMANCTGSDMSIRQLHGSLRTGFANKDVSPHRWHLIDSLIIKCQRALSLLPDDYLVPAGVEGDSHYQQFRQHASVLAKHLNEIQHSDDRLWLERIKRWQYTLQQIISYRLDARVTFSPKLRLPCVTVGPSFLRSYFESLWDRCQSACLLSATLYVCVKPGQFSSRFVRIKLCIPSDRALEAKPFVAPWIYNSPTLYSPDSDHAQAFAYPGESRASPGELENWFTTIAHSISILAKEAAGGTLVLCNSYSDTEALGNRLNSLKVRLIIQTRDDSVKALAAFFKADARTGKRPVWLATGPAWTGIDLRDELAENAADDRILTDLVITRTPMGRNRTAAHVARVSRIGFEQELLDAAFTLRQGLGRLIRREHLTDRRIWFLDGRIHTKRGTFHKINALLRTYPQREGKHAATKVDQ
jgi:ATP-dependent DNA helicase DinG